MILEGPIDREVGVKPDLMERERVVLHIMLKLGVHRVAGELQTKAGMLIIASVPPE